MAFNRLSELLTEKGEPGKVDDITAGAGKALDGVKKGLKSAQDRHKKAADDVKAAEDDAKQKQAEAERQAKAAVSAEEAIKKKAEKEAEQAAKAAAAEHKVKSAESIQELRDDIDSYLNTFFDQFPYQGGSGGVEDILDKYQTKEAATEAYTIYTQLADRIEKLSDKFLNALVTSNRVRKEKVEQYRRQAIKVAKTGQVPGALSTFVRSEAKFFKRLIRVNDKFQLDPEDFTSILSLKIKQTDAGRIPDAAQALEMLFKYMASDFRAQARTLRTAITTLDDEDTVTRKTARTAAAAKTASEEEADAKATEPKVPSRTPGLAEMIDMCNWK